MAEREVGGGEVAGREVGGGEVAGRGVGGTDVAGREVGREAGRGASAVGSRFLSSTRFILGEGSACVCKLRSAHEYSQYSTLSHNTRTPIQPAIHLATTYM